MAHPAQIKFITNISKQLPQYFNNVSVLEVGSLNINGTVRGLFKNCNYIGLDLGAGKDVDIISPVHLFVHTPFDTIICTEMLEHDQFFYKSLKAMYRLLKKNGLLIITAASTGRKEHGTKKNNPQDSPFTDYYKNVTREMIEPWLSRFKLKSLKIKGNDIQIWSMK